MEVVILDDETSPQKVHDLLKSFPLCAVVAVASFAPQCKALLKELESMPSQEAGGCCGGTSYKIVIVKTDASDDLEEIAVELGLNDVPSFQIYKNGTLVSASPEGSVVTAEAVRLALDKASSSSSSSCCPVPSSSCCPAPPSSSVACCPSGSSNQQAPVDPSEVLRLVATSYANTVNKSAGGCCVSSDPNLNAYNTEELLKAGAADANLGLGCGNPMTFANIQKGETIVDLGSGAGIDCFLASHKVGPSGKVIGVDMTPDMIHTARQNAQKRLKEVNGTQRYNNVQFRLGEIEYLPIPDNEADCIISNCVINLSPDKPQVFREIFRVLKSGGGRIAISDVVNRPEKEIPDHLRTAEGLAC